MKTDQIMCCVVALLLGMLLANMLKSVCGCKVMEGQEMGRRFADGLPGTKVDECFNPNTPPPTINQYFECLDRTSRKPGFVNGEQCGDDKDCRSGYCFSGECDATWRKPAAPPLTPGLPTDAGSTR